MSRKDKIELGGKFTRRKFIQTTAIAGAAISVPWVWTSRKSWAATVTPPLSDARAAFDQAVAAFNGKQPDALSPLLDLDVTLKKLHIKHEHPVIKGRGPVIDYLRAAWNGVPPVTMIFDPYSGDGPKVNPEGPNRVAVTGLACWKDNDGDKQDGELSYTFKLENGTGVWLVTDLSGTYTGKNQSNC
jgi:hypothetical protein